MSAGPLRTHPTNPRYFTDDSGKAIYLAGAHTWANLQDMGPTDPPAAFDYPAYLDWLEDHGHNFTRLWTWEQARYQNDTASDAYFMSPMPYRRTGPGLALDGKPRFDLERFDDAFFTRLRNRVAEAGRRGIYVAVMLFNGWSIEPVKGHANRNNPWRAHPFNGANNVNGVEGGTRGLWLVRHLWPGWRSSGRATHVDLANPAHRYQKRYVERVVDAVNDLDNVLYEVSNESPAGSQAWQYEMIRHLRAYEATKPKRHPVGMTVAWPGGLNAELFNSPADWVSPNSRTRDYLDNPPAASGRKVILSDTDHLCGICGNAQWPWKSFTQGMHPIFMDVYDGAYPGETHDAHDPEFVSIRKQLGYTVAFSRRMDLGRMTPQGHLSSTGYCLANRHPRTGEYLVYAPQPAGPLTVDLSGATRPLSVEWLATRTGETFRRPAVPGGAVTGFTPPFEGDAVLYLKGVP